MDTKDQVKYTEATACQAEKRIHDLCFFNWYQEEFLTGRATEIDSACEEQWETYKACLNKKITAWELEEKIDNAVEELHTKMKEESPK